MKTLTICSILPLVIFLNVAIVNYGKEIYIPTFLKYNTYTVTVSFYTLSRRETDRTPRIGALNTKLKVGRDIAVSRDLMFLLGKRVYIEGFGVKRVADLMNKRFKNMVDVLVPNKKIARKLGIKRNVKMVVLN